MKRRFALPIAAAVILHAALLFGFRSAPEAVPREAAIGPYMIIDEIPTTIEMVDSPELTESGVRDEPTEQIQGDPEARNVSLPDFPSNAPRKSFTIPVQPFEAVSHDKLTQINSGIVGTLEGAVDGVLRNGAPLTSGMLDSSPRAIVQTSPIYPGEAKVHGIEGRVLLGFTVDEAGRVISPYVINRTDRRFEEAALRAVSRWKFEPGRRHGRVVRFRMAVPILFSLND